MLALVLKAPGDFVVETVEKPAPGPDDCLVRVEAVTVCAQHDWAQWQGPGPYPKEPGFPGHEGAGVVEAVGENVWKVAVGDHVAMTGIGGHPLYQQYVCRHQDWLVRLDPRRELVTAAPLELAGCVLHAVRRAGGLAGRRVAVSGLGPAGLLAVQLVRLEGPQELIGIDILPERLAPPRQAGQPVLPAEQMGADRTINARDEAAAKELAEAGVDVVVDCSGSAESFRLAVEASHDMVILMGVIHDPFEVSQWPWFWNELTIRASKMLDWDDFCTVGELWNDGRLDTASLITHRLPLHQYADALRLAHEHQALKVAVLPHGGGE